GAGAPRPGRTLSGELGSRRLPELRLDPLELGLVALPDRALEPLAGRDHVPACKQYERSADHDRRVVEGEPVEVRLEGNPAAEGRKHEDDADEHDPEDRDRVDPLVVAAEVPGAALELLARTEPE